MPFPASPPTMPDFHVAQLHAMVLGGGMSSRLFQEVREKRGLCYSIYAFTNNFQDTGFTGIYAGTGEKEAGELSAVIAGEMEAMTGAISDAEIWRVPRRSSNRACLMGLERPGTRAEQIAGQIFALGRVQSVAEIVAQIDAVDAAALKRYAVRIMAEPSIAAMGPVGKLERHDVFAARFARGPSKRRNDEAGCAPGQNARDDAIAADGLHARPDLSGRPATGHHGPGGLSALSAHRRLCQLGAACGAKAGSFSPNGNRCGPTTN